METPATLPGPPFEARYKGWCEECEGSITPGQQVRYCGDYLVHVVCPTEAPTLGTRCATCHLVHPGIC